MVSRTRGEVLLARSWLDGKVWGKRDHPSLGWHAMGVNYQDIITIEPGKRGGKPCIRGMRITVYDVLSYLAAGMSHQEILDDFPYLTEDDILACLSYAADRERQMLVVRES
jgi:uncharacterized protein (DUF433 family)